MVLLLFSSCFMKLTRTKCSKRFLTSYSWRKNSFDVFLSPRSIDSHHNLYIQLKPFKSMKFFHSKSQKGNVWISNTKHNKQSVWNNYLLGFLDVVIFSRFFFFSFCVFRFQTCHKVKDILRFHIRKNGWIEAKFTWIERIFSTYSSKTYACSVYC